MSEEYYWNSRSHEWVIPKPGDLIEISRVAYEHWAVYVGSGYVIHLAPTVDGIVEASTNSLMSIVSEKALVKKELLKNIVGDGRYCINNKYDSEYCPRPANKIIQEAESLLGKKVDYSVATFNCEHFVTNLRYGKARSDQVKDAVTAGAVGVLGFGAIVGLTALICSAFSSRDRQKK
ncbi:phospholipase A and acyltransferase 3-like [Sceloporus undulatus]|uniref:phospholipase A and acyltransferase 3-like n=1 Tax=Sceloporus undulatus TaxID=8520 RepID=UPI001C4B156D|nr:phospholipase A and acyltransferase 3-like [Sceloporus undulatus]